MNKRHALFVIATALGLGSCERAWPILESCDYDKIAEKAIKAKYPWFQPRGPLVSAQYQDVVIAFYAPNEVKPGGTAHVTIGVRNCKVKEVWLTQ
ncbi:hypothetical protein ACIGFJ_15175 [Brevundimonas diminuta]|uniref:hypothetical protein n=1 Tax=Brevundimonas diminuta TaxID=293 RepID=UPI001178142F|nr:hypothetical protein [Brevundimonas diminuta]WQE46527.1 hypothetical protein U0020_06690 [Brevundimonas diminuta]